MERVVDMEWLQGLAGALAGEDEAGLVTATGPLLGDGARVTVWRATAGGWVLVAGDDQALPDPVPTTSGVTPRDGCCVVRAGDDRTTARLLAMTAPALDTATEQVVAQLLHVALERVVATRTATAARQRLQDNERIGQLGSYDWHVPTDTNRWSDQLYRIYGEEPQSFNASYEQFLAFIHPDDRDRVRAIHQEAFQTGEPYEMEERIVLRDGTERLLWSNGEVVMGPDGTPERFIGICRDVTEQRAAEEAAAKAEHNRQLLHDGEIRRRAALELNDAVVQGLTAAMWAAETGAGEVAKDLLEQTMASAREMMDDLLVGGDGHAPGPGELRRSTAPLAHLSADAVTAPPMSQDTGSGLRVVLADDAPDVRLLLSMQLRRLGLQVVGEAENGREAIELVDEHGPDIVLLDLSMPEMDGLEATRAIRAAHPDVRIVIVSGYAASSMEPQCRAAGADAYVEKGENLQARLEPVLGIAA